MKTSRIVTRLLLIIVILYPSANALRAQTDSKPPTRLRLAGPDWLIGKGALRCDVNQRWDLVIEARDEDLKQVDPRKFPPQVSTTNEGAVAAKWDGLWNVRILCTGDGQSQVSVQMSGLNACIPVLSGKSRNAAPTPCSATPVAASPSVASSAPRSSTGEGAAPGTNAIPANKLPATARPSDRSGKQPGLAPENVTATVTGVGAVTLSWRPAAGAVGYVVSRSSSAEGPYSEAGNAASSASSHVVKGVRPGTAYFTVTANYPGLQQSESGPVSALVPQPPQPKNFRASSGPGYVLLEWDAAPEAVGYTLTRQDGGAAVLLDNHFPKRATPLLKRTSFTDTQGPGGLVGYVLSAVYRDAEGREYVGDPSTMPRTPATPLPPEPDTSDKIQITKYRTEYGTLYVDYHVPPGTVTIGWVNVVRLDVLQPAGWRQVNAMSYNLADPNPAYRTQPNGGISGGMWIDEMIPTGCEHARVFRLRVEWSVGGGTTRSQPATSRVSRPFSVTYDSPYPRCH